MKANELRIGTLVWNEIQGVPCQVDLKIIRDQIYGPNYWQPIPLTEEWLIKFGFESANIYSNFKFQDIEISSSVRVIATNVRSNFYLDGEIPEWMKIRLYYVHQLQNLYFALTGEELTITQ